MHRAVAAILLALACLAGATLPARAQLQTASFSPTGATTLSVTSASARVAFASFGPTALITNTGSNRAFVTFGGSGVTATTSSYLINAGCSVAYDVNGQGYVAAITAASTTTLTIVTGSGLPTLPSSGCGQTSSGGETVVTTPVAVTPTDNGGTITLGGTSQTAIAANTARKGCWIQNPVSATEDLYVSSTAAAVVTAGTPDDADLAPGGSYSCNQGGNVVQTAIRVNAATTSHAFIAKETQ